jgi:hypothetical protein
MIELNFMEFLEAVVGPNQPGRAGQHVWKPEAPVLMKDPMSTSIAPSDKPGSGNKHIKGVDLKNGFRPMYPANFKPLSGKDFGYKIKTVPTNI